MHIAGRTAQLRESVIREMTRLAMARGAVNLSQGFPDFDPPRAVLDAAAAALAGGQNQYTVSWGLPLLRQRLAERYTAVLGWDVDPDRHVVVTCGVTEAIACAFLAVLDRGDEVIVLEPAHETYGPAALLADVDFYKVGHHGSRNATPRKLLWENFRKRKGRQLKTMMSTMPGKHGTKKSKTEVPRETLLTALKSESQLLNTDDLPKSELVNVEVIRPFAS